MKRGASPSGALAGGSGRGARAGRAHGAADASRPGALARVAATVVVWAAALCVVAPFVWMVLTSLKSDAEAMGASGSSGAGAEGGGDAAGSFSILPRRWMWVNYARAVEAASLDRFYLNSVIVAGVTTVLSVAHNALAGFALSKLRVPAKRAVIGLVLGTMMLPAQVSFLCAYLIAERLSLIDTLAGLIVPFLASSFGVYYMKQATDSVPDALLEAARTDGMTELQAFWHVVAPCVAPAAAALSVFTFVSSWNSFFWPFITTDSAHLKTMPVAVAELAAGRYVLSWPVRMAAATLLTLPLVGVFLVFQRAFVRGVTLTGMKD